MINIEIYIEKLQWLKEWLYMKAEREMTGTLIIYNWEKAYKDGHWVGFITEKLDFSTFEGYCIYKQSIIK